MTSETRPSSSFQFPSVLLSRSSPDIPQSSFLSVLDSPAHPDPLFPQFTPFSSPTKHHHKLRSHSHQILHPLECKALRRGRRDSVGHLVTPGSTEHYQRTDQEIGIKPIISYQRPIIGKREDLREK
jgi:hypothetical protein